LNHSGSREDSTLSGRYIIVRSPGVADVIGNTGLIDSIPLGLPDLLTESPKMAIHPSRNGFVLRQNILIPCWKVIFPGHLRHPGG
jgi:hypothetical protein